MKLEITRKQYVRIIEKIIQDFPKELKKSLKNLSSLKELKKELKFLSSFLSCYFPKTFGYLEISYLKCYIES